MEVPRALPVGLHKTPATENEKSHAIWAKCLVEISGYVCWLNSCCRRDYLEGSLFKIRLEWISIWTEICSDRGRRPSETKKTFSISNSI